MCVVAGFASIGDFAHWAVKYGHVCEGIVVIWMVGADQNPKGVVDCVRSHMLEMSLVVQREMVNGEKWRNEYN